jgi:release factor glutamine methyltransferase
MPSTIGNALAHARHRLDAAGIEDAALEAEVLLRHALSPPLPEEEGGGEGGSFGGEALSRAGLYARLHEALDATAGARFEALLRRRLAREPTAYITGWREFYGLDFEVTPAVLIPRPETETLVEAAIEIARKRIGSFLPARLEGPSRSERPLRIADIGTGSGCIAIALAVHLPPVRVIATDVSEAALDAARRNARRNGVGDRIDFRRGDLLSPLDRPVDLLLANLPYVKSADVPHLEPELRDHEPHLALAAGPDGLDLIRRLLEAAPAYLTQGGAVLFEFGIGQAEALTVLASIAFPNAAINVLPDLAGRPRVLRIVTA